MKHLNATEIAKVSGGIFVLNNKCTQAYANEIAVICCGDGSIKDATTQEHLWTVPENMELGVPYLTTIKSGNNESKIAIRKESFYFAFELW